MFYLTPPRHISTRPKATARERPLLAAGSTDRCNTFGELLSWGLIEQGLSRPFIKLPPVWHGADPADGCRRSARSPRRPTRTPGQIGVRSNSSARRPASDPRSRTAGPPSNKCDVAASCTHSIFARRLECCAHQLNPPRKADIQLI